LPKSVNCCVFRRIWEGNTTTKNFNGAITLNYTKELWNNNAQFQAQISKDKGELTKEKYFTQDQLSYTFNKEKTSYFFGNGNLTVDHFSAYSYQGVLILGYGHYLVKNKTVILTVQAGPGLRRSKVSSTQDIDNNVIGSVQGQLTWNIKQGKYGTFSQIFRDDFGPPYDYIKSVTAYQTQITKHIALEAAFTLEYYSNLPEFSSDTKRTDTTTTLNLVYNF